MKSKLNFTGCRAVWITDQDYAAITFLSVSSFLAQIDIPICLIYTGEKDNSEIKRVFESLSPQLEWMHFYPDQLPDIYEGLPVVVNRLARIHALRSFPDGTLLLLDSDTAYSEGLAEHLKQMQEEVNTCELGKAHVFGVIEHRRAWDAGLFFQHSDGLIWKKPITSDLKTEVFQDVFGEPASRLQLFPQYNNGILIFSQGNLIAETWEEYYLKTVGNEYANLLDDQLPLAVAMYDEGLEFNELPAGWNSLGRWDGEYFAWHPWAGKWKTDLVVLFGGGQPASQFGKILAEHLERLPESWREQLREQVFETPAYSKALPGSFLYGSLYSDFVRMAQSGWKAVEIGKNCSPSTFFMAELIRSSGKEIEFDSIREFPRANWTEKDMKSQLELAGLTEYISLKTGNATKKATDYPDESLDFVCYDLNSAREIFEGELIAWYGKVKPGGWMVGFDESIYETFGEELDSAVLEFCHEKRIPCQCDGQVFLFRKPIVPFRQTTALRP
jgi:hypothetical protein